MSHFVGNVNHIITKSDPPLNTGSVVPNNPLDSKNPVDYKVLLANNLDKYNMPKVLWQLLSQATPHGHEHLLFKVLMEALPKIDSEKCNRTSILTAADDNDKKRTHFNYMVVVAPPGQDPKTYEPTTMFSCHLDTVHDKPRIIQPILTVPNKTKIDHFGFVFGARATKKNEGSSQALKASTLGADDKVGVYIMVEMINHNIPGFYMFHFGEERGGIGSADFAKRFEKTRYLRKVQRCIAFDRAGYSDVITHQGGQQCCSSEFALALAKALNAYTGAKSLPLRFSPSSGGVFTDSKNYAHIIPECTNLSVGYHRQHGPEECFDLLWLTSSFLPAVLKIDWEALPTRRKPEDMTSRYQQWNRSYHNSNVSDKYGYEMYPEREGRKFSGDGNYWPFTHWGRWELKDGVPDRHNHERSSRIVCAAIMNMNMMQIAETLAHSLQETDRLHRELIDLKKEMAENKPKVTVEPEKPKEPELPNAEDQPLPTTEKAQETSQQAPFPQQGTTHIGTLTSTQRSGGDTESEKWLSGAEAIFTREVFFACMKYIAPKLTLDEIVVRWSLIEKDATNFMLLVDICDDLIAAWDPTINKANTRDADDCLETIAVNLRDLFALQDSRRCDAVTLSLITNQHLFKTGDEVVKERKRSATAGH